MEQNIFPQEYFKIIQYLYQLKKKVIYSSCTTPTDLQKSNGTSRENIENITKSNGNFAPYFVDHHVLSGINFNGHCLMNNNISIPKTTNKFTFLQAASWV